MKNKTKSKILLVIAVLIVITDMNLMLFADPKNQIISAIIVNSLIAAALMAGFAWSYADKKDP